MAAIRCLSPELQLQAENELNEAPSRIEEDLKHMREWLSEQPHLINIRSDDQWILSFLRGCKYNLPKTKQKLDTFYSVRNRIPEFFGDRDPFSPDIQEMLKLGICLPLPRASDLTTPRLLLLRHKLADPQKIHIMSIMKVLLMTLDILLHEEDHFVISGASLISDCRDLPMAHMLQMSPKNFKKTITCLQDAYPVRPKGVYYLNVSSFFESMYKLLKYILSEKNRQRVHLFSEKHIDDFYNYVPRAVLPAEYDGEAGAIDDLIVEWKKKVESYRDWFLEDAKYCSDESKRPEKPTQSFMWSMWNGIFKRK